MTKKIDDYKKERGKLIDSIHAKLQDIKKIKSELNKKGATENKQLPNKSIYFNQKMIKELESLNDFDSYDIQKLALIKLEVAI
jgi:hypothetical protein